MVHPDLYRLYSITVSVGNIIDIVLPETGLTHVRKGSRIHFVHRGIGGSGDLRIKLASGPTYWDFVDDAFIGTPDADCLIAPGYICTATYIGDGGILWFCTKKLATPNTIL